MFFCGEKRARFEAANGEIPNGIGDETGRFLTELIFDKSPFLPPGSGAVSPLGETSVALAFGEIKAGINREGGGPDPAQPQSPEIT